MNDLETAIRDAMAAITDDRASQCAERNCTDDELEPAWQREAETRARGESLRYSGVSLPAVDISRVAARKIRETPAVDLARRWLAATPLPKPLLIVSGSIGCGKTMAAAWAIAEVGGGAYLHATEVRARVQPWTSDLAAGVRPVNLRNSFMVLDDLGTESEPGGKWGDAFALLLENRLAHGRTMITTNHRMSAFAGRYGERAADRLRGSAFYVELPGSDSLRGRS